MKLNLLTICDVTLALLLVAFCWGVGEAWLAVPAVVLTLWAFWSRRSQRESPDEREKGLRRVRAQLDKDMRDPTGTAPSSAFFNLK